ncbi:MAG: pantetheine-phosphate adenylyltransferase [Candidatus Omnitrophica bacterium]|nr:pantetheine-phosphate adenylyltransferase [Candidatus Omnitrophota bacterium]
MKKRRAIYPGTFDPITYGHIDLIQRAARIFDEVLVAVADNRGKVPFFSVPERLEMIRRAVRAVPNVQVDCFDDLMVNYAKRKKIPVVIRGLRMVSDFEYEFQMALTNRTLNRAIETLFLMPSEQYSFLSSSLVKELARLDADISAFAPGFVEKKLKEKLRAPGRGALKRRTG